MTGATIITNEEYKKLILSDELNKKTIKELEIKINNTKKQVYIPYAELYEKKFFDDFKKDNTYYINQLKDIAKGDLKKDLITNYHYETMQNELIKFGITDLNFIYEKILEFVKEK